MIILEEDLDVSSDLMDYFSQLIPVLDFDESLFCISAWNDQVHIMLFPCFFLEAISNK